MWWLLAQVDGGGTDGPGGTDEAIVPEGVGVDDWVAAAAIFVSALLVAFMLRRLATRFVERRDAEHGVALLIGRLLSAVVVAGGVVYALSALGVRLSPLLGALGIGGVALAFALQHVLENWFAAVLIQVRRPFTIGDQITADQYLGTVEDINFRAVVLRSIDGDRTHIPASVVIRNSFQNHTAYDRRRTTLTVGVAYGTDLTEAQRVLTRTAAAAEGVLSFPPAEAWVETFGESTVDFAVRFWHPPRIADEWRVRSNVAMAVKLGLDTAGIEIPFPQRALRFTDRLGLDAGPVEASDRVMSGDDDGGP